MARSQANLNDRLVAPPQEVIAALKDLCLISSAAAQLGGYGVEVSDLQRRALTRETLQAKSVLDRLQVASESDAVESLRRLVTMCEGIIDLYSTCQGCPSAVWREVGRLAREAYRYIDARKQA